MPDVGEAQAIVRCSDEATLVGLGTCAVKYMYEKKNARAFNRGIHVHGMCSIAMPTRLKSTCQKDGVWRAGVVVMVVFGNSFVACPLYGLDKELAIPADSSIH